MKQLMLIKRDGRCVPFDEAKLYAAIGRAFLYDCRGRLRVQGATSLSVPLRQEVAHIAIKVSVLAVMRDHAMWHAAQVQDALVAVLRKRRHALVAEDMVQWRLARDCLLERLNMHREFGPRAGRVWEEGRERDLSDVPAREAGQVNYKDVAVKIVVPGA